MAKKTTMNQNVTYPNAKPIPLNFKEIDKLAEKEFKELSLEPGFDIEKVVSHYGGELLFQDYDDWLQSESGSIIVRENKKFQIMISAFTGFLRNRFTIAHELGHWILHSNRGEKTLSVARYGNNLAEKQANRFAAGFLMPIGKFKTAMKFSSDPNYLISKFLVSQPAVKARIETLRTYGML